MNLKKTVRLTLKGMAAIGNIISAFLVGVSGVLIALALLGTHMLIATAVLDLLGWWGFGVHAAVVVVLITGAVLIRDVHEVGWWIGLGIIPAVWPICLVVGGVEALIQTIPKGWSRLCAWCEYES